MAALLGHETYSESFNLTAIENTNLYYFTKDSWDDYKAFLFIQANGWNSANESPLNRIGNVTNTNTYTKSMDGGSHTFTPRCVDDGANMEYIAASQTKQNVKIMLSKDGGSTYSEYSGTTYPGTIKATRYLFNNDKKSVYSGEKTFEVGGVYTASDTYASGVISSTITFTASATNDGYEFVGWGITNAGPTKTDDTYKYLVGGEATIYAYYKQTVTTHTVTFHANGHGEAPTSQTIIDGETATAPTAPTAEGYTFVDWYTTPECTGNAYVFTTAVTADLDLYAKWTENKYSVTITAGEGGSVSPTSVSVGPETSATITATPNKGYGFSEWTTSTGSIKVASATSLSTTVTATATGTVTAKFTKYSDNSYWYFDSKNTGWDNTIDSKWKLIDAGDYAYVSVPARNSDDNFFKIFSCNPKNDNTCLIANADKIATGTLAGGIGLSSDGTSNNNIKMPATTSDYFVILYYPNTTTNPSNSYLVAASYTLPGGFLVTYDYNGGSGSVGNATCEQGQSVTLPTPNDRTGYTFNGWYTAVSEGTFVGAADATYTPTANITLYAQWTEDYSAKEFWYFDENNARNSDGNTWPETEGNGLVDKWKMTNTATYAYIYVENSSSGNKFKIGYTNWKVDDHLIANDDNIAGSLAGNIGLVVDGEKWKNIFIGKLSGQESTYSGSYYVVLYYPNVAPNTENKYQVAAMTELPNTVKYPLTFGVIGENGNLTAKSGGMSISSGDEVATVTLTAEPTENYEVAGWYSDAAGNSKIEAAGTNTTYTLTLTAATSVYVKFKRQEKKYWYMSDRTGWNTGTGKQLTTHTSGVYAFIQLTSDEADTKFKVREVNESDDNKPYYGGLNINNGFYGANIDLTHDTEHHNAVVEAVASDWYVILYFPNTKNNPNDNYILCASTSLPVLTDPVTVSFGVVGNTGGALTAKSGNSTITSGTAVSYVTFTAAPVAGYTVEGWYSDAAGTTKIDAAGTNTTYTLSPVTESNCNVYVKFAEVRSIYFKNNHNWNEVHVYTFTNRPFDDGYNGNDNQTNDDAHKKGVGPKGAMEKAQMTHIGNGVYVYQLTNATPFSYVAFTEKNQYDYDNFYDYNNVVYRQDHSEKLSMYIPNKWEGAHWVNLNKNDYDKRADYFYEGIWMKPNSKDAGYMIAIHTNETDYKYNYFTTSAIGGYDFSFDTVLTEGTTYKFFIKNDNGSCYSRGNNAGDVIAQTTKNHEMYFGETSPVSEVTLNPTITGTYTFTIHLSDGKVLMDVIYPENEYRLVYVEKSGSTTVKYHPSHIIKQRAGGTEDAPLYDTISMHVRPNIRTWNTNKYDTTANGNTCEVQLQQRNAGSSTWTVVGTVDVKTQFAANGVYNFVLKQVDGAAVSLPTELIHSYTGSYYILTDAFDSNWSKTAARDSIKQRFWYSNYADNKESFSHYCCKWTTQGTNLKFVVANDYSYCITDTLIRTDYEAAHGYVSEEGKLNENANVRFMWQHYDNTTDRAYITNGDAAVRLISSNSQITEGASLNLSDQQNWVYAKEVHARINTRVKIEAAYHGYTQYLKGQTGDFAEDNTEILIKGIDSSEPYLIRVIYDFKTNHLICAWMPEGEISGEQEIESDIMLIRRDTCSATQITFNNANLKSVQTAYGVVELTKAYLENTNYTAKARANYWISFPFDVNLSDVFGNGTYGKHYMVQYYDGEARAAEGQYIDSPTRWKFYRDPTNVVLKKGLGYVLVVLPNKLLSEQFTHGNSSVRFYFPSANTEPMDIDGTVQTVTVPEHKCTITKDDCWIYDSNWNIIGVPTWANFDEFGNPKKAVQVGTWEFMVGFYYKANTSDGTFEASVADKLSFQSMYSYLVQWAGTINWKDTIFEGEEYPGAPAQQALQARRYAPAAEGEEEGTAPEQYTLRLTLNRGEKQLDHTYVRLQEGNVTTDFDLNYDMTKILNSGANLYSLVGTNLIQCAANVQPLQEEAQTISIPLGVVADQDGLYTFSLPDGTEGMNVSFADFESGTVHNLALGDYQTALTTGTYEGRFALEIQPRHEVSTGCEQTDAAGKRLRKVLIDGNLYILRDGKAYTATGNEL
ncbi:MAG: InlB B-repeat-containing protein [Paludibacteraceae bacterium]